MKSKILKIIISSIVITILINVGYFIYFKYNIYKSKQYFNSIKNNPKVFIYDTSYRVINPVLYITNLNYKESLITYYKNIELKNEIPIDFPLNYMRFPDPVFLIGSLKQDTSIVEVVDFNTHCWGYVKGYVYYKTVHLDAPSDSLINQYNAHLKKLKVSRNKRSIKYGIQCY
jgi:hypothetical protein